MSTRWTDEVVADNAWDPDTVRALQSHWNATMAVDLSDLSVQVRTWLFGDFDPRTLHRRDGWALRRYRGEHRGRALTVAEIRDSIDARAHTTRAEHLRSLRRHPSGGPPAMIYLGKYFANMKFYGVPADLDAELGTATLEIVPDLDETTTVPALKGGGWGAEDADTGPILMAPQREHEERMARIHAEYAAIKSEFDIGVTRELVSA